MVSIVRKTNQSGVDVYEVYCLSTDTKPIDGMTNGSTCFEVDTAEPYAFDEENATWNTI